jgi:hypothetical protein
VFAVPRLRSAPGAGNGEIVNPHREADNNNYDPKNSHDVLLMETIQPRFGTAEGYLAQPEDAIDNVSAAAWLIRRQVQAGVPLQ